MSEPTSRKIYILKKVDAYNTVTVIVSTCLTTLRKLDLVGYGDWQMFAHYFELYHRFC